ncbi:sterol desaturase family protein [Asticcacaulis sp. SL142]|uniref:sterol desaturase family protein n=1 Tax=Asticcacaulis sp. SL142 TaxID=2995155 RepID=UPI00226D25BF|nr:sterol desaturase family protein [Asticcacaulis sp. SL142]WAC48332.1 sterol desaturase family protein [Asticcacaulis sp. SL142]
MIVVYFITALTFTLIFTHEVIAPASGATCDKRWQLIAGGLNAVNFAVIVGAGFVFETLISKSSFLHMQQHVDPVTGGVLAFLLSSLLAYWWHRATHESDTLWRLTHQLHHAPQRIEALTAFYLHPLDSLMAVLLNVGVAYGILGVNGLSLALALILAVLFDLVAHADKRTPRWLGYITQRPEMHRIHHQRDHHRQNYGLPVWDMLFGTYANPQDGPETCGFDAEKSSRVKDMLLFRDVHKS